MQNKKVLGILTGLLITLALALAAWWVTQQVYAMQLPLGIPGKVLEYPLWAVLLGLLGNGILHLVKRRDFVQPGVRTELFLKTGLVLLGAGLNLTLMVRVGGGAVLQALILISCVFLFCWWLSGKFGLDNKLRAVMSTAISVCGVSAAIAAAGAVMAKKEQVTYVTTLVILIALPMMVLAPLMADGLGLSQAVAGAWFGGNIDTTAAVVGAGTIYGKEAQDVATIVKNTQNLMIGVVAFVLAIFFAARQAGEAKRPSPRIIWDRFPKFVLGFILASVLYTLSVIDGGKGTTIDAIKNWMFTLAFVAMGLDFSLAELRRIGWRPVVVFLIVTVFNTLLALGLAWVIFTHLLPLT